MKKLRIILVVAALLLCICFCIELALSIEDMHSSTAAAKGFPVHTFPEYSVALYHGISFFLFLTVLFAKRYFAVFFVSVGYMLFNAYATYVFLRTGFFGGDMCPQGGLCWRAISRASWFDWTAASLLLLIFCLTVIALFLRRRIGVDNLE
jgi:hypothetical protein